MYHTDRGSEKLLEKQGTHMKTYGLTLGENYLFRHQASKQTWR